MFLILFFHCYILYVSLSVTSMSLFGFTCKLVSFFFFFFCMHFLYMEFVDVYSEFLHILKHFTFTPKDEWCVLISVTCRLFCWKFLSLQFYCLVCSKMPYKKPGIIQIPIFFNCVHLVFLGIL